MGTFLDRLFRHWRFREVIKHIPKNSIVCDIGCGKKALFLKDISSLIRQGIGLDEAVKNYNNSKLELKRFKVSKSIPLEKESCEVVIMMAVLEHLSNPQEILDETFRILKDGGKLILTTPLPPAKPILELLAFKLRLINRDDIRSHRNYFWPKDIKKMLTKAGFKENNIKNSFFGFYLNSLVIAQK